MLTGDLYIADDPELVTDHGAQDVPENGFNITIGAGTFVNSDCVIIDVLPVSIGDDDRVELPWM